MHPESKNWHLVDYVLVHKHNLKDDIYTNEILSAESYTGHRLVSCKLRQQIKPKSKNGSSLKKSSI